MKVAVSLEPAMVGRRFGQVEILSMELRKDTRHPKILVRCFGCQTEKWIDLSSLRRGTTNGCQKCSQPRAVPQWLDQRLTAAKQRCTNPNDPAYPSYGGRGIEFRFPSVKAAAVWVLENLGAHREKELDRRNNDGHYEPGNLRWVSKPANLANRGKRTTVRLYEFRTMYPEVRYADNTLRRMIASGMTPAQIAQRWRTPSCKPKGVYGTFSTPDHDTVSQCRDA